MKTHNVLRLGFVFIVSVIIALPLPLLATDAAAPEAAAVKEAAEGAAGAAGAAGVMDTLNINTASVDALSKIPGVGPKIGEAIAAYREANGAFSSISDLANVEGIDAGLLEKITPFLSI